MSPPSVTSTDSFRIRAQRSEERRIVLVLGVLLTLLLIYVLRRALGGVVMTQDRVFYPCVGVLIVVLAYEAIVLWRIRIANRTSQLIPASHWIANAVIELLTPIALLTIMHYYSPRGEVAALSGPTLLVLPLLILLSILRLRPRVTFWTGVLAAMAHAALVVHAIIRSQPSRDMFPVLFAYAALLALCGISGAFVAGRVKQYVHEAADEAAAAESARQHIQLMERDLSIAREIQRGLLPSTPPELPGFEIAGISTPADQTGGDYYDWQTLPDGRVTLVMADVTGHGIGPALVMAVCRAYARASTTVVPMLGPFMNRLNSLVHADISGGRFITFAIALVNPKTSSIELLSAGHGPTFLYRAREQRVERFGGDGLPLGVVPDGEYADRLSFQVGKGDILLMLTDGFFEWQRSSDNQAFGIARIDELLIAHADASPEALLQIIDRAVRDFTAGSSQNDDMTAVALKKL